MIVRKSLRRGIHHLQGESDLIQADSSDSDLARSHVRSWLNEKLLGCLPLIRELLDGAGIRFVLGHREPV